MSNKFPRHAWALRRKTVFSNGDDLWFSNFYAPMLFPTREAARDYMREQWPKEKPLFTPTRIEWRLARS